MKIYVFILVLLLIPLSLKADVLTEEKVEKLLSNSPNILETRTNDRSLQIWILTSDGRGIIWCESLVNEDKAATKTICFDKKIQIKNKDTRLNSMKIC